MIRFEHVYKRYPNGREQSLPLELSTGEQQRVGIARAVVSKPAILIADEPTGNLDPDLSIEVMNIFQRFNEVGVTVLIASHDLYLLEHFPVRRVRLESGRIVTNDESQSDVPLDPRNLLARNEEIRP
jgi:cell division transport system ATP-binding protein